MAGLTLPEPVGPRLDDPEVVQLVHGQGSVIGRARARKTKSSVRTVTSACFRTLRYQSGFSAASRRTVSAKPTMSRSCRTTKRTHG